MKAKKSKPGPKLEHEARYLLKLPAALDGLVREAARQDGVSLAQWWRSAGMLALIARAKEG